MVGPAPVWVEGPPVEPRPFGLFTVAQVVEQQDQDGQPAARFLLGTRYEVDYCGPAYDSAGVCFDFGTLSVAVDDAGELTITAAGFPIDGDYQVTWGDEDEGDGPTTVSDLDGATHTYDTAAVSPATWTLTVAGPQSYGAQVTFDTTDGEATDPTDAEVGITKQPRTGVDVVEGEGFAVLHLLECNPVGRQDLEDRARRALQMGEQRAVERVVSRALARHPDAVLLTNTSLLVTDGLAALEKYAAANYPGRATIHATPDVITQLDAQHLVSIRTVGGREVIMTGQGTLVVSGGGYSPLMAPEDDLDTPLTANDAGTEHMYVTGAVQVRRAAVIEVNDTIDTTGTAARNSKLALAERPYVVTWECMTAAVPVATTQDAP